MSICSGFLYLPYLSHCYIFTLDMLKRTSEALRKGEEYWITINETSHKEDDTIYLETKFMAIYNKDKKSNMVFIQHGQKTPFSFFSCVILIVQKRQPGWSLNIIILILFVRGVLTNHHWICLFTAGAFDG